MRTITVTDGNYSRIGSALAENEEDHSHLQGQVAEIISEVKKYGDEQLVNFTNRHDRNNYSLEQLTITQTEIDSAFRSLSTNTIKALEMTSVRIHNYYEKMMPADVNFKDKAGVELGARWLPIDSAGLYVEGGKNAYPSSVLMNAVPARVAGVKRIVMVTPTPDGELNPAVLAAAKISGITEIYRIGGAQSIAALTYGTRTIDPVDKIVGGGDAYANEAKRQVFGKVGVDMIAGPSEILVIADDKNDPYWVAADLLAQAEHDISARAILITTSQSTAQQIISCVYELLPELARYETARRSIEERGLAIVVKDLDEAAIISNLIAPEHLQLAVEEPRELLKKITNAGAIFLGRHTPEAIGDYVAGPSHVLPTSSNARFSSGLSVTDFMKRQSIVSCDAKSFKEIAGTAALLANIENLGAHALSVTMRQGK